MSLKFVTFTILAFLGMKIVAAQNAKCVLTQSNHAINHGQDLSIASIYPYGEKNIASISNCKGILSAMIAPYHPMTIKFGNRDPISIKDLLEGKFGSGTGHAPTIFNVTGIGRYYNTLKIEMDIDNRNKDPITIDVGSSPKVVNLSFKKTQ
ncbi:unnamed protein product [Gordionus sp. m RMFG-2023]|uniref:uncharacterized protein LOC135930365 n=1 Tax=Gordionus sp. m RMFG-2023 TaxID=3053472 RepID=UPI0030DE0327